MSEEAALTISGNAKTSCRKSYPPSGQSVRRARRDVVEFAASCGFSGQALDDIEVAVGEGLANAVEHGVRGDGGFVVMVRVENGSLVIEIKDDGRGFDHGKVCAAAHPPVEALRGFGTFIMRELMDAVQYSEAGTRLELRKRLIG
jgi:serine/threonine-protein kinase RsbW